MGAPQVVAVVLMAIGLTVHLIEDGKPQSNYSFGFKLLSTAGTALILWWGGFWS